MSADDQTKPPDWYDAVIDEFLSWIEVNHDEWHRRMDDLHRDLEKHHKSSERE